MRIALENPKAQELGSPAKDPPEKPAFPRKPPRRKIKKSGSVFRLKGRSGAAPSGKRGSRRVTPLLRWKFDEGNGKKNRSVEDGKSSGEVGRRPRRKTKPVVSARKLGAGLWRLHSPEEKNGGGGAKSVGVQYIGGNFGTYPVHGHQLDRIHSTPAKDSIHVPRSLSRFSKHGLLHKFAPSFQLSNSAMEGLTKWDKFSKETEEISQIFMNSKTRKTREAKSSRIASLERELELAKSRIEELEGERRSSKKKLEHFLRKLGEERAAYRIREHEKIRAFVEDAKRDLDREKKNTQRLEKVNSKLVNRLTDAKSAAKRYVQEYEKERKSREAIEEVCEELAREMGENRAQLEALKIETDRFREEVDEERKMLQMAEVWREERVQMKLIDAKVMLEEKYSYMKEIASKIESFLTSRGAANPEAEGVIKRAQFLRLVASSVDMKEIREIKYEPANADDIFSVFEDGNFSDKEIQLCNDGGNQHQSSSSSNIGNKEHRLITNACYNKDRKKGGLEAEEEGASEWETVSHNEDRGSSYSGEGSDPSVNDGYYRAGGGEVDPSQVKKGYSLSKLWRSSHHESNSGAFITVTPRDVGLLKGDDFSGNWGSSGTGNQRVSGNNKAVMKGCIEWPRSSSAGEKGSLKTRLLEARMETQKLQLRQVLKQKI